MTTIHVTAGPAAGPIPVAVVRGGRPAPPRALDPAAAADLPPEDELAGLRVRLSSGRTASPTSAPSPAPALVRSWADRVREGL